MTVDTYSEGAAYRRLPGRARSAGRLAGGALATPQGSYVGLLVALVLAYAGSAHFSYLLQFAGPVAAIVWLPAGIGIAFLTLGGLRLVPGVIIGDLLANEYMVLPLGSALGQTVGNTLEVAVAAVLLRRLIRRGPPLESVLGLALALLAVAAGTALSATIGVLSLLLGDVVKPNGVATVWRTWWLGDLTGALIVVPLALAWWPLAWQRLHGRRAFAGVAVMAGVGAVTELSTRTHRPIDYLVFPGLICAALLFRQRGATLAVALAAGITVRNVTHYAGPFAAHDITRSVLSTQLFLGVAAASTLVLAATLSERDRLSRALAASRRRLLEGADAERRELEQNLHDGAQQRLTWVAAELGRAANEAAAASGGAPSPLAWAEGEVRLALTELRDLAHGIHPPALTELGLPGAIAQTALRCTVPIRILALPKERVDRIAETTAYYVFAEAVANAQKHASASSIHVAATATEQALVLEVVDDGNGGANAMGPGLQGLRDRVEGIGGRLRVTSTPGCGTAVRAAIPLGDGRRQPTGPSPER